MTLPSDTTLSRAAALFNIDLDSLDFIRQAANVIYGCVRDDDETEDGQLCILRLTPAAGRDSNMLQAELEFMEYLGQHECSVPQVFRSTRGNLVETIGSRSHIYHAALFEYISGEHPEGDLLSDEVLRLWGRTLGRIHRLGQAFQPANTAVRRPDWHTLDAFQLEQHIPADQTLVREKCRAMLDHLRTLPTPPADYGLVHGDPEPWNIMLHDGAITVLDFDDCCYHWYAFDVAVAVMYAFFATQENRADDSLGPDPQHIWAQFYAGYREEHALSDFGLAQIPVFLRLRVMEDYAFSFLAWDEDEWEDWMVEMAGYQRQCIETDTAPITFDTGASGV